MPDFENLDFYELLGVSRSASPEEIKRGYRQEISKYHPDRFVNASPAEREYASRRSQRITEAYSVLSDFAARSSYNRGELAQGRQASVTRRPSPPPAQPRDHQAELYEQAQQHLAAGRTMQAIAALRHLQQLNPFYRDSAELLAAAEERAYDRPHHGGSRSLFVAGGLIGSVAMAALVIWAIMRGGATSVTGSPSRTAAPVALAATERPTQLPAPTLAPTSPTAPPTQPPPTAAPTRAPLPTAAPPTAAPVAPTATQGSPAPVPEQGRLLFADTFRAGGWADTGGIGWRVGYQRGRYRIAIDPGIGTIWSYRTGPARDVSIGVDVQVTSGEGGLLLRFLDENNYLSFSVNPQETSFRLEQHSSGEVAVLVGGQSEAIAAGTDAWNRLVARLRGDHVELLANNLPLAGLDVPGAPDSPHYGLLAISGTTTAEAYFDNLEIRALK